VADVIEMTVEVPTRRASVEADDLRAQYLREYAGSLRLAYLLTGDRQAAEDLVQEAFVRIFSRPRRLQDASAFPAYIRRTITNLAFSRGRSANRERLRVERVAREDNAPDGAVAEDASCELLSALDVLPDRQRAAVVMRFWLDLGEREMAQILRCRPGTVKSLLSRALATLRGELDA
jgi:RNA polymerase sigma-70 factor (sigma-E family)